MHQTKTAVRCLMILAVVALLLASLSCSGKKTVPFKTAPFALNSSLLGPPVDLPRLGLQFSPPLGWQPADTARLDAFRRMQAGSELFEKFYPVNCLTLYIDSINGSIAYVGQINDADVPMADVAKRYTDFLEDHVAPASLMTENYRIDNLDVYYFLNHTDQVINYKLLGETRSGGKFLIEYVCTGQAYPAVEGAITSSVASLQNSGEAKPQPTQ